MSKLMLILVFLLLIFSNINAQFADKNFYLIDSLDLNSLEPEDRILLDSICNEYQKAVQDTDKLELLFILSESLLDNDTWPKYNELLLNNCNKLLDSIPASQKVKQISILEYKINAIGNFAYEQLAIGNIDSALYYYYMNSKILEEINDKQNLAANYHGIGYALNNKGAITKGLEYMHKSLKLREELNDSLGVSNSLINIGFVYKNQNENEKALEYFEKSLSIKKAIKDSAGIAYCLGHIGAFYHQENKLDLALKYYNEAINISKKQKDYFIIAHNLQNLGLIYQENKKYSDALKLFNEALEIRKKIDDNEGISTSYYRIGNTYFEMNKINEALSNATEALKIAQQLNFPYEISQTAGLLHKIYKKQSKWKDAYKMYELEITMRDSINNEQTQKATIRQQMQYVYEKEKLADSLKFATQQEIKDLEIKEKQAKIQKQRAELDKEATKKYALYGGIILLSLLAGAILIAFRNKKRDNEVISKQKDEVEAQKKLLEEKNKEVFDSINYAQRIQQALLQTEEHVSEYFPPHFILFKPKDIVSGDFYWSARKENNLFIAAVDCTGHGVPGAFMSMLGISFLNEIISSYDLLKPAQILDKLRERIIKELNQTGKLGENKDGMDISLIRLNTENNIIEWAGANNPLYIIRKLEDDRLKDFENQSLNLQIFESLNLVLQELKGDKMPIGLHETMLPYTNHSIKLNKNDKLYIFSDGYADQFGGTSGKKFKYKAFKNLLLKISNLPMVKQKEILIQTFENWKGNLEQVDDVCIIGIEINE